MVVLPFHSNIKWKKHAVNSYLSKLNPDEWERAKFSSHSVFQEYAVSVFSRRHRFIKYFFFLLSYSMSNFHWLGLGPFWSSKLLVVLSKHQALHLCSTARQACISVHSKKVIFLQWPKLQTEIIFSNPQFASPYIFSWYVVCKQGAKSPPPHLFKEWLYYVVFGLFYN